MRSLLFLLAVLGLAGCASSPSQNVATKIDASMVKPVIEPESNNQPDVDVEEILSVYKEWRGTPYRMGGETRRGIDCSAFTQTVVRDTLGITLPRSTSQQVKKGVAVKRNELQEGDLVFFHINRRLNHVGVYIGNGEFIHASSRKGVTRSHLSEKYWAKRYWQARRINS